MWWCRGVESAERLVLSLLLGPKNHQITKFRIFSCADMSCDLWIEFPNLDCVPLQLLLQQSTIFQC